MRGTVWLFQKRLKDTDCSLRSLQDQLETPTQKSPLFSLSNRLWLYFIQNTSRVGGVALIDVQFGRSELRSGSPFFVAKESSEFYLGFIPSSQRAQHFRRSENGCFAKG